MSRTVPVVLAAVLATACVTINVYFPAAAAQKAADRVIDQVWGSQAASPVAPPAPAPDAAPPESPIEQPPAPPVSRVETRSLLATAFDFVMPVANAAEPNLDVTSPEIQRLTGNMESRFAELSPFYSSGAVGLSADGYIAVHDPSLIPLPQRNPVRNLVANENADRAALYHEMAAANGQPQWESQIRSVFAQRWVARAKAGWWYQDSTGAWKQK